MKSLQTQRRLPMNLYRTRIAARSLNAAAANWVLAIQFQTISPTISANPSKLTINLRFRFSRR